MTLLDLFDAALAERRNAPAYGDVTYGELHAGAARVAAKLRERGVRLGDRISLFSENRVGFVYAYLAALRLGAIVVPTNVLYRAGELEYILENAEVGTVLVSAQTAPHLAATSRTPRTIAVEEIERWAADDALRPAADFPRRAPGDTAVIIYTSGTTGRSK